MSRADLLNLREHPNLKREVAQLLNSEWPRSESARLHSLACQDTDDLPCSLVLITTENEQQRTVIGHSRLCKVHNLPHSVLIESVIIKKEIRGHGLGRKIMELTENFAARLGYKTAHLSTHNKCKFYEHLGYEYSSCVSPVRANAALLNPRQFAVLQAHFGEETNVDKNPNRTEARHAPGDMQISQENKSSLHEPVGSLTDDKLTGDQLEVSKEERKALETNEMSFSSSPSLKNSVSAQMTFPPPPPPPPVIPTPIPPPHGTTLTGEIFWMVKQLV